MNEVSPDGLWRWNGTEWVPNEASDSTMPATPLAPPPAPTKKKMPTKQKALIGAGVVIAAVIGIGTLGEGGVEPSAAPVPTQSAAPDPTPEVTEEPTEEATPTEESVVEEEPTEEAVAEEPAITPAQQNALRAAESYLAYSAFSKAGLIDQLSSEYGSGFEKADAKWAVNNLDVDWNEQAVKAAENYLEYSAFSRSGLIDQLSSEYGSQFTKAQATYAADKMGL